ncbi:MAG: hypothetical protein J6125_02230, partial [Clostridia bacterium]|nr:hypothetical protein [Clostridia bacterium]
RKVALLADARWGEAGESVDAGALTTYLRDHYVCVRLIRVRVTDKMKKDEEGLYVLDGSRYVTEPRTDEEQAAQRERADELRAALGLDAADPARLGGQDLDALWAAYNEDPAMADTRGVCYLSDGSAYTRAFGAVYPDVTAAALTLGEGEATAVEEAGSVWIVCRVAPADEPWSDGANRDFFDDLRLRARASLTVALLTAERERVQTKSDAGPAAGDFAALSVETSLFPRR